MGYTRFLRLRLPCPVRPISPGGSEISYPNSTTIYKNFVTRTYAFSA
nr:MAG TPA: hypothetical protein [Caudoviricetes sp.]